MIRIAFPERLNADKRRWRLKKLDKFHQLKLLYFIRQKYSFSRLVNFITYKREAHKKAVVNYLPPSVQIESSTGCALQCPGCLIGTQNATGHPGKIQFTSLSLFKKEIDLIFKKCLQIYFHMHAEPLLNEDFFEASKYASSKGLWTGIHTNLYPNIDELPEKILDAGLCNLVISIDGATQETYEKYRIGGDVEMVFRKMQRIANLKKDRKSKYPWITAKFLVFEHNWHEIKLFKEKAIQHGADEVLFITGFANGTYKSGRPCTEYEFNLDTLCWKPFILPGKCPFIWEDLRIDTDGGLLPCGNGFSDNHKFFKYGHESDKTSMVTQFNAPDFVKMRNFFLDKSKPAVFPEPCGRCEIVNRFNV